MQKVGADSRTIRQLLGWAKFKVDDYQREYRWEAKQVAELLDDLTEAFLENYEPGQKPSAVEDYSHYFLGSVIISNNGGQRFIVDGQQRLTTLTLLLIHLYRKLPQNSGVKNEIAGLISSWHFEKNSFNLDVPEREACMQAIFEGKQLDAEGQPESLANIISRFEQIEDALSGDLPSDGESPKELPTKVDEAALPYFANWLIEKVYLVEVAASSDADAYTIFETTNDRGLSLTPTEMLKGYLLNNIEDSDSRATANSVWKARIAALQELGKEEDADAIKAWLRSHHANELRERSKNATPRDFERIGTEFHRWVGGRRDTLGLRHSEDFTRIITEDFDFYTRQYRTIRQAGEKLTPGLEAIYYNARNNFTLQYTVLLAPLLKSDTAGDLQKKLRIVATYLDILIARRIWNWSNVDYSTMSYTMFSLVRDIRRKGVEELAQLLVARLEREMTFADKEQFRLHGTNAPKVHYLLARMTDYIETESSESSKFDDYIRRGGRNGFEIEHIWADHHDRHTDEFVHPEDFRRVRNYIGGLLLLPKSFNASYGDMRYEDKHPHYFGQNLLAKSLHHLAYENNPDFLKFIQRTGLPFKAHPEFKKKDNSERQELYRQLAERIWDSDNLLREAGLL